MKWVLCKVNERKKERNNKNEAQVAVTWWHSSLNSSYFFQNKVLNECRDTYQSGKQKISYRFSHCFNVAVDLHIHNTNRDAFFLFFAFVSHDRFHRPNSRKCCFFAAKLLSTLLKWFFNNRSALESQLQISTWNNWFYCLHKWYKKVASMLLLINYCVEMGLVDSLIHSLYINHLRANCFEQINSGSE